MATSTPARSTGPAPAPLAPADHLRRVVSLSPNDASTQTEVFLTPRVVDQACFDELAGALRTLLDEGSRTAARLDDLIAKADRRDRTPVQASVQLQDRLHLGARMLKALQSQIASVEGLSGRLESERAGAERMHREIEKLIGTQLDAIDARAKEKGREAEALLGEQLRRAAAFAREAFAERLSSLPDVEAFERRVSSACDAALERIRTALERLPGPLQIEALAAKIAIAAQEQFDRRDESVCEALAASETRAVALEARLESLERALAGATDKINEMSSGAAAAAGDADAKAKAARAAARHCGEAGQRASALIEGAEAAITRLDSTRASAEAAAKRVGESAASLEALASRLERDSGLASELALLERKLEPWKRLFAESDRDEDGTPRPVTAAVEALRAGVGSDLARLSTTMRELARRVDELRLPA